MKAFASILAFFLILTVSPLNLDNSGSENNLMEIISEYEFSYSKWQFELLKNFSINNEYLNINPEEQSRLVWDYFNGTCKDKRTVETIIAKQIEEVLAEEQFFLFPRVSFTITSLPTFLIISPRNEIRREKEIHLSPGLTIEQKIEIEKLIDDFGISSFITDIAGTTTFPIVVYEGASLRKTIEIVAHEWIHQYLFFRPLGFRYALHFLGLKNDDIAAINEAAATMIGKEIEEILYYRYYHHFEDQYNETTNSPVFDFRGTMQNIREHVDHLLFIGEIEEAERYMEEQRIYINSNGFNLRKLNQAYFAFHGSYPSISNNPLTEKTISLRLESDSIKNFLNTIGRIWRAENLLEI